MYDLQRPLGFPRGRGRGTEGATSTSTSKTSDLSEVYPYLPSIPGRYTPVTSLWTSKGLPGSIDGMLDGKVGHSSEDFLMDCVMDLSKEVEKDIVGVKNRTCDLAHVGMEGCKNLCLELGLLRQVELDYLVLLSVFLNKNL
ncbi:hypothetical protein B0H19DRAFT_1080290 [Mycena capillaripes]|nr:hypothetical protein B0H19DRAFT_1080290 [Mycena capillaripes]